MSDLQAPLKVAGIGAGYFAQFHYDAWKRIRDVELVAVADQDNSKARAFTSPTYGDAAEMLMSEQPDLVDIITPPLSHGPLISLALETQAKAIICQKPFCSDLSEATAIANKCEAAGVPLIVHENFRFQPWYRALKGELERERVGQLLQVTFRLRPGDGQDPDAYLSRQPSFQKMPKFLVHETAIHWIDTFRYLLGEPTTVYADLRQLNPTICGEDAGMILFGYKDGLRAVFDGNRLLDHPAEDHRQTMGEASVEGTKGEIKLRGDGSLWFRSKNTVTEIEILGAQPKNGFGGDCVHALQSHVVSGLLDGRPLENTALSYLRNLEIEAAVYRSAEIGQRIELSHDPS
ncbi:MAG: Gfo/Idh/MocA family oxidoreductase [Pseudomonadota bacterium]